MFILKTLLLTAMVTITRAGKVKDTEIDKTSSKCEFDCKASGHICCQLSNGIQECRKDENCPKLETSEVTTIVNWEILQRTTTWNGLTYPPLGEGSTIADKIAANSNLSTLFNFLKPLGLVRNSMNTLNVSLRNNELEFTVFAPDNAAFDKLGEALKDLQKEENREELRKIIERHILQISSLSIKRGVTFIKTYGKENIIVFKSEGNQVGIESSAGEAMVTANIEASNGFIHIVNGVF